MRRSFVFLVWQWTDLLAKHPMYNGGLKLDTLNETGIKQFLVDLDLVKSSHDIANEYLNV